MNYLQKKMKVKCSNVLMDVKHFNFYNGKLLFFLTFQFFGSKMQHFSTFGSNQDDHVKVQLIFLLKTFLRKGKDFP